MITLDTDIINRQVGNVENKGIIFCWETYKFHAIKISGNRNQYLQYFLNDFYHDVDDLKKATILWSVAHWGQYAVCRTNDNSFVFNRMLGYNTALYDNKHNKWEFDRVNNLSATCYIKHNMNHFTYLQPLSSHQEEVFLVKKDDELLLPRVNVYPSPEVLVGIHQNIIPLYSLVMSKNHSLVELVGTEKKRKMNIRLIQLLIQTFLFFITINKQINVQ